MIIDAHVHVWDLGRAQYPWLGPSLGPINRTVRLEEVRPALERAGVTSVVLVQSADDSADTANMLDVAARSGGLVAGVVGWVPMDRPELVADALGALRRTGQLVGVRNLIHDRADPLWITRPGPDDALGLLDAAEVPFDFVTADPEALTLLPGIGERHPGLRLVVDHLGKPPIGGTADERARWRNLLRAAAENPRVFAKVSGLYAATGDPSRWTSENIRPFVLDAVEIFGADRLMFGGDWPISVLAGGYERVSDAVLAVIRELPAAERDAVLAGTATTFYGLRRVPDPYPDQIPTQRDHVEDE